MATAVACDEPNNMECTVCHEHFTLPKLLPCGHLLCRHCLVSRLKSQPEASCPLCRYAIVDPKERKGRSLEDIADGFPTDLAMAALVEADRLLSEAAWLLRVRQRGGVHVSHLRRHALPVVYRGSQ